MIKKTKILLGIVSATLSVLIIGVVFALRHEMQAAQSIEISFTHKKDTLGGTLLLPKGRGPFPLVIFIHGDGPQTRGLENYALVMNELLRSGIACYSWDKAGTGESSGNWLDQTMGDRAEEAIALVKSISERSDIDPKSVGFLAFSQGGWVIPEIAKRSDIPAFYIAVGAAVNWRNQGEYFTRTRLARAGIVGERAEQVIVWQKNAPQPSLSLSYGDYLHAFEAYKTSTPIPEGASTEALSEERYHFIALNIDSDASQGLSGIKKPLLAIWGADDLNVDASSNAQIYKSLLEKQNIKGSMVKTFSGADHKMLKSDSYATQLPSEWTTRMSIRYFFEAESAFVPGYLGLLSDWIGLRVNESSEKLPNSRN